MPPYTTCVVVFLLGGVFWSCTLGLQRPPPRYSQQFMPDTSFSCRHKIVGSYYADPETDCQLFHVCVSVAGSIQDYRFLCPNDTAFDQESQTCADWYDVDCEAATLYYASDNFDLYRIGSGLESVHYDSIRSDAEPLDHLQRSESSDAVRSSANSLNRVVTGNPNNNNKDILRGSSSGNFYNNRNNGKEDDYDNDKMYREENPQEPKRKVGLRKLARKQQYNSNNINNLSSATTSAPTTNRENSNNYNSNGNYFNGNNNFNNERQNVVPASTSGPVAQTENFNRNSHNQRNNASPPTYQQPISNEHESYKNQHKNQNNNHGSSSTTKSTVFNSFNTYENSNRQNFEVDSNQNPSTTDRTTEYNFGSSNNRRGNNQQTPTRQYIQNTSFQPTTVQPSINYQASDSVNSQVKNDNSYQQATSLRAFQPTTVASTFYDAYNTGNNNNKNNNNNQNNIKDVSSTTRQVIPETTQKYFTNNFAGSSYIPTTFSPASRRNNENNADQAKTRGNGQYDNGQYDNGQYENGKYYDKSTKQQPIRGSKTTQYYDTTKSTNNKNRQYDGTSNGKYSESSTRTYDNFDLERTSVTGFSPASINHLAETARPTTPAPRRSVAPNVYNPSTFGTSTSRPLQMQTTLRGSTSFSASPKPFSTTVRFSNANADTSTKKPKSSKKNDYDYAYYDNTGPLEYDGLDLEHVSETKDSAKVSRN